MAFETIPPPQDKSEAWRAGDDQRDDAREAEQLSELEQLKKEKEGLMGLVEKLSGRLEETHRESTHDELTGVLNLAGLKKEFQALKEGGFSSPERPNRKETDRRARVPEGDPIPVAILMVDVDHFKDINDTYGHPVGDAAIKAAADYLQTQFHRTGDLVSHFVSRLGGDEFVVVLQRITPEALMQKIHGTLNFEFPVNRGQEGKEKTITVNLSGGLIRLKPNESLERALERADEALYLSKQAGGNEINIFEEEAEEEMAHNSLQEN